MITEIGRPQIAKVVSNESPSRFNYIAFGTSGTAESRSDTLLYSQVFRDTFDTQSYDDVVLESQYTIPCTQTSNNYSEFGMFDSSGTAGIMYDRKVFSSGTALNSNNNIRVTNFTALNIKTSNLNYLTDTFLNSINNYLTGVSYSVASHISLGTNLRLDKIDVLGTWHDEGSAATTPTIDSYNYTEGIGCMKIGKDGGGSANFMVGHSGTAQDLSGINTFGVWLRIEDSTTLNKLSGSSCLQVRIGSGTANNFKYYNFDNNDLIVGWQRLLFDQADMTSVGSPDMTIANSHLISMNTNNASDTITHGYLNVDYLYGIKSYTPSSTSMTSDLIRKSATISRNNTTISFKSNFLVTEGNNFCYTQTGLWDAVSSGNLLYIFGFNDKNKKNSIEIEENILIYTEFE